MLILEGPDCIGKTSLANSLLAELKRIASGHCVDVSYAHIGQEAKSWDSEAYLDRLKEFTIQDRWHLSELAYGQVFRGESNLTEPEALALSKEITRRGCFIVVLFATYDHEYTEMLNRYHKADQELFHDFEKLVLVNDAYRKMAHNPGMTCFGVPIKINNAMQVVRPNDIPGFVENIAKIYFKRQLCANPVQTRLDIE